MSSVPSLKPLADNRDALLLAEAIGWLHDYRKCSEEHLKTQSPGSKAQALPRAELAKKQPNLQSISLTLQSIQQNSCSVTDLLNDQTWSQSTLGQFLSRCHNTSHFDKQEPVGGEQTYPRTQMSSPFGFEQPVGTNLTQNLWSLPWNDLAQVAQKRQNLREHISSLFSQTVADSRRPINEVDLWSWGAFVGALYKTSLAGALLKGTTPEPQKLQWRLLSVRVDGLAYISNVARIPDLLARQQLLDKALDAVCDLLEVTYPLGSEVYRDENGSVLIVPDVPDLLDASDGQGVTLREGIVRAFSQITDGELLPEVTLEQNPWWGQDPKWSRNSPNATNDRLPDVKEMLTIPFIASVDVSAIESLWRGKAGNWELCPVCRLRPMEEGREACTHCEKRRGSRIADWKRDPRRTIWMDEIADANGRVALIVGKFGLDDWLSGDLVQTMLVRAEPNNPAGCTPKNPSPARLRRVWETCRRFWTETVQSILDDLPGRQRWLLEVQETNNLPPQGIVCDGTLNDQPISVWRLNDALLTVSFVPEQPSTGRLHITWEDQGQKGRATYQVIDVQEPSEDYLCYHPALTLLASPDQFLALVPAADALEIADKIRAEYETQFGKVRNRLPLFLGIVFFPRKTPLLAVMDTARRMLETPLEEEKWEIAQDVVNGQVQFKNGIQWNVPTLMGDGQTSDEWYPYFFIIEGTTAPQHPRRFQLRRQSDNDPQKVGSVSDHYANRWLVHVNDLGGNDAVSVTPSRFAYLWLDHTARRFAFDPAQEVLLLEELPRLMHMWTALKKSDITDTGLRNVQALLEAKAATWGKDSVEFAHLVDTTLKEASLYARKDKDGHALSDIVKPEDVLSGRFFRCLELYLHILKQKVKED